MRSDVMTMARSSLMVCFVVVLAGNGYLLQRQGSFFETLEAIWDQTSPIAAQFDATRNATWQSARRKSLEVELPETPEFNTTSATSVIVSTKPKASSERASVGVVDCNDTKTNPKVFVITFADTQGKSKQTMLDRGNVEVSWIPGLSDSDAFQWLNDGKLILQNNISLVWTTPPESPPNSTSLPRGNYTFSDAAKLLSHLRAIRQAYQESHESVLILEEGVTLNQDFFLKWQSYACFAPSDWTILQWATSNPGTLQQGVELAKRNDLWVSWLADHNSTHAYTINRMGMQGILAHVQTPTVAGGSPSDKNSIDVAVEMWTLREPNMLIADELIFYLGRRAYTSTYPWIHSRATQEALGSLVPTPWTPGTNLPGTNEQSILVLMAIQIGSHADMQREVHWLRQDVAAVCSILRVKCHWRVFVAFPNKALRWHWVNKIMPTLPSNVVCIQHVNKQRFNKFSFVSQFVGEMADYDLVLFKDNDQRIAGFPWNTFLEKKQAAVIAGNMRQAFDNSLLRNKDVIGIGPYSLLNSRTFPREWKNSSNCNWCTRHFTSVTPLKLPFLEMHFALFDGDFAKWFFSKILYPFFVKGQSDWGPDLMWCMAAKDFKPEKEPCLFVPVISLHENTNQIVNTLGSMEAAEELGEEALLSFYEKKLPKKWMEKTSKWIRLVQHNPRSEVEDICRESFRIPEEFDVEECAQRALVEPVSKRIKMPWIYK